MQQTNAIAIAAVLSEGGFYLHSLTIRIFGGIMANNYLY